MLELYFRATCQRLVVDSPARLLGRYLSPNTITLLSLVTGVAAALAIIGIHPYLACVLLLVSGYFDMIDGTIARLFARTSPFGAMLDVFCDRMVEWAVILGLYGIDPVSRGWPALLMLGSVLIIITGFLSAAIFIKNDSHKSFNYTPGLMERPEAFAFFAVMICFPAAYVWLAVIFSLLVLYTAGRRMIQAWRILEHKDVL